VTTGKLPVAVLLLVVMAGFVQFSYDSQRGYFAERDVFLTLPTGKVLKVFSFGYHRLVADVLFIWSIQFYSSYHLVNRFDHIERIFNVITDLRPKFRAAYYIGSIIMALEAKDYQMAIRLLQKGSRNMSDEWVFDYEAAYYARKYLGDYRLAETYYRRALRNPSAPALIRRQMAHMVYLQDNLQEARKLWADIYQNSSSDLERNAAIHHLYQIKFELDKKMLETKIRRYRQHYGRNPINLNELRRTGLINEVPKDFSGQDYLYDLKTGTIQPRKSFKWKRFS